MKFIPLTSSTTGLVQLINFAHVYSFEDLEYKRPGMKAAKKGSRVYLIEPAHVIFDVKETRIEILAML